MILSQCRTSAATARNITLLVRHGLRSTTTTQIDRVRHHSSSSSISSDELTHFSSLASSWWDPLGPSRILHLMNPLRHEFIAACLSESNPRSACPPSSSCDEGYANTSTNANANTTRASSSGLRYLDIGCGGGIFAESLARTIPPQPDASQSTNTDPASNLSPATLASSILAIDPSPVMIKIATSHARADPLVYSHLQSGRFKYENTTLEALLPTPFPSQSPSPPQSSSQPSSSPSPSPSSPPPKPPSQPHQKFDMITLFEVLEHVNPQTSSPRSFLKQCLQLLHPGGWLIGSTIARTVPSFIVNQVIAEAPWPIGVVPRGTHEWGKFVDDDEVERWVGEGLRESDGSGVGMGGIDDGMRWKCVGAMYFPGLGWRMIPGTEKLGNYFWAVQRGCRL
ncbi:3-demethylubiquinone-9 3-methyltransferase [Histoplasma capsulatum G186AR]|uniref:3-demethylubiquinone-9 3-methyltransferase n=1 Tax=Ajellomyces capsulatus (strain G186AR / H82 / ATCC MYA-2454 / RMSCC 2432) TaxID=447093 RepID=C0NMY8_AJECG|nr:3-demethylubiquinone-9 3-methyltransferase [Histoplasma capsulatum G186AR]EEH07236.1 3-demethylubiquinone-9 3-methyltransferase [Histoplasma capsulatum G186AR]